MKMLSSGSTKKTSNWSEKDSSQSVIDLNYENHSGLTHMQILQQRLEMELAEGGLKDRRERKEEFNGHMGALNEKK